MIQRRVVMAACASATLACGDSVTDVQSIADLAGRWVATRVEYTVIADPSQHADLLDLGGSASLAIESDGRFTWTMVFDPAHGPQVDVGTVTLSGQSLIFDFAADGALTLGFTLTGDVLSLEGEVLLERGDFGFASDDFAIPARFEMVLRKS